MPAESRRGPWILWHDVCAGGERVIDVSQLGTGGGGQEGECNKTPEK